MHQLTPKRKLITVALVVALCAVAVFSDQNEPEIDATARARIEQTRSSIVTIEIVDQSNQTTSHVHGLFIRKDLVATDAETPDKNFRIRLSTASNKRVIKVVSVGHYLLPYVLVEPDADSPPVKLGDSERIALNDSVYILADGKKLVAGKVTGFGSLQHTRTFLLNIPINSNNKGAPIFNRYGEVIGMATKDPAGESAGLAWPSEVLATMTHLNEPGVGVGAGDGRPLKEPALPNAVNSAASTVDSKPVRLSTPSATYTEAARANRTEGSVVLRVRVGVDGNVNGVSVVRGLPDGLTEQAITAARASKFKPAMKDGNPVPYWVVMEISFTIR